MKKLSDQKFIKTAKSIHGCKYDYSKVDYINTSTKVIIICPEHGEFLQTPNAHTNKTRPQGCPSCSGNFRGGKEHFISQAREIYGGKYDYSKVDYKNNRTDVTIICPIHGEFTKRPHSHINRKQGCPKCGKLTHVVHNKSNTDDFIQKARELHGDKYDYSKVEYVESKQNVDIVCKTHGIFQQQPNSHLCGKGCPKCSHMSSLYELKLVDFLKSRDVRVIERNKSVISPYELDIYLPDYNLAIEVNGMWWHGQLHKPDTNYHLNKTLMCERKGIRLIHYTDKQLKDSYDIITHQLDSILNMSKRGIFARKCEIREISTDTKNKFLTKYHLQGNDSSSIKLGLFYRNKLVSVMTFCKKRVALGNTHSDGEYELSRFCNNFTSYVIGGASRLLKYFERNYNPSKIITYADRSRSVGDMYIKLGFDHSHNSKPNYWYFTNGYIYNKIYHRYSFRKSVLVQKLDKFDPNKTEWENMKKNGYNRYWDCGNMVFEKTLN